MTKRLAPADSLLRLALGQQRVNSEEYLRTLMHLADLTRQQGRYAETLRLNADGERATRAVADRSGTALFVYLRGTVRHSQGQLAEAAALLRQAADYVQQDEDPEAESRYRRELAEIESRRHRPVAAYAAYRRYMALHDTLVNQESARSLNRLQLQYDVREKTSRIAALTQQQRLAALRAEQQQARARQLAGLVGGLVLALVAFAVFYGQLRRSRARLATSEAALRTSEATLQAVAATKDRLMAVVGHDLRGPLTALAQGTGLVGHYVRQRQPDRLLRLADHLTEAAGRLTDLLDYLLH